MWPYVDRRRFVNNSLHMLLMLLTFLSKWLTCLLIMCRLSLLFFKIFHIIQVKDKRKRRELLHCKERFVLFDEVWPQHCDHNTVLSLPYNFIIYHWFLHCNRRDIHVEIIVKLRRIGIILRIYKLLQLIASASCVS